MKKPMKKTIKKTLIINYFGFPIVILDCPHLEVDGDWEPSINYSKLEVMLFEAMPFKPSKLNGAEIKFIRNHLDLTQKEFAAWLNDKKVGSAISKWEASDLEATGMEDADERSLRLQLIDYINTMKRRKSINLHETLKCLTLSIRQSKQEKDIAVDAVDYAPVPGYGLYPKRLENHGLRGFKTS